MDLSRQNTNKTMQEKLHYRKLTGKHDKYRLKELIESIGKNGDNFISES